jgi:hypothetical protein
MFSPAKEYLPMMAKMHVDALTLAMARANFGFMRGIKMLLGLFCILPILEAIHSLIEFSQL